MHIVKSITTDISMMSGQPMDVNFTENELPAMVCKES